MMRSFVNRNCFAILIIVLLGCLSAAAQTARVTGHVTDGEGAAIPGATVEILSQDGNVKQDVTSDAEGIYTIGSLPPGNYRITVQSAGFDNAVSELFTLAAGQAHTYDAQLAISANVTKVTVTENAGDAKIELDTASASTTLSTKEVTGLGLNGRNFSQLITMAPGVSNQSGQDEAKVGVAGSAKFSVNGGRVEYNTFEVDGSDVLNTSINASRGAGQPLMVYPSIDAIDDIKVLTSNYSALYGKSASGSVIVTTRSGTPAFHGNIYEFIRNEVFNARNYFDQPIETPTGLIKRTPLYRRQDFGGTIGGPLFIPNVFNKTKDKTFFFFSEETRLEKTPVEYNQAVPTVAERSGDFSDVCPPFVPGSSHSLNQAAYPDCPQNTYQNTGRVTPSYTSQAILNTGLIPLPNSTFGCDTTNPSPFAHCYDTTVSPSTYWREELFRIDHSLTPSEQLSFRYIHDAWHTTTLSPQWGVVQNSFPTVENLLTGPGLDMVANLTQSLPHGFLNRIGLSFAVEHITLATQAGPGLTSVDRPAALNDPGSLSGWTQIPNSDCGTITATLNPKLTGCGMGYIFNNGYGGNKMPGLVFQGTNGAYGGHGFAADTGYAPWNQSNPTYSVRDDASKAVGKHLLQFGAEASLYQENELSAVSGANSGDLQGLLTFSNQQSLFTSGNAFADFLAGPGVLPLVGGSLPEGYTQTAIKSYTQDSGQRRYYTRYKDAEPYIQDDWTVNSRLTINAGLRVSLLGNWYNPNNTSYNWRPEEYNPALGASIYVNPTFGYIAHTTAYNAEAAGTPVTLPSRSGPYNLTNLQPSVTNGLVQCGVNGISNSCMKSHTFNPGPRIGLSLDPFGNGKTAIRAGYGLFWEHGTGYESNVGSLIGGAPLVLSETESNVNANETLTGNSDVSAYNAIGLSCQGGENQCGTLPGNVNGVPGYANGVSYPLNVTSIPTKTVYSYTQQWSLTLQHELKKSLVGQVGYVGTRGDHLTAVQDLNQLQPLSSTQNPFQPGQPITSAVCNSGATYNYFSTSGQNPTTLTGPGITSSPAIGPTSPGYQNIIIACTGNPGFGQNGISADALRPYPGFSKIIAVNNIADSKYHALQATLRETTKTLTIGAAYTYSHSTDDSSDRYSANFANSLDLRSNYASSDFDQRHLLNISYVYDLPLTRLLQGFQDLVGPGDDADAAKTPQPGAPLSSLGKAALDGWQISGITTWQTGTPFSVINGGGSNGTGAADNAGVGDALGIGSYVDVIGKPKGLKPAVPNSNLNVGPLLLNPGAFAAPRGLSFGDSGRNFLNNPSRTNFNASLLKHFKTLNEKLDIEFRAEAYNVFNHTQFRITDPGHPGNTGNNVVNCYGDISTGYSAGATGCLAGNSFLHPVDAHDPRILQFGLKGSF